MLIMNYISVMKIMLGILFIEIALFISRDLTVITQEEQ